MTPIKPMYGRQNVCSRVLEVKGEVLLQTVGTNYYRLACCIERQIYIKRLQEQRSLCNTCDLDKLIVGQNEASKRIDFPLRTITYAKKNVADTAIPIGTLCGAVGAFHSKAEKDILSKNVHYLRRVYVCCVRQSTQRCSRTSMTTRRENTAARISAAQRSERCEDPDVDSVAVRPRRHVREGCEAILCGSNVHGPQQTASDRATSKGICAI
jgi:hypothetical protein